MSTWGRIAELHLWTNGSEELNDNFEQINIFVASVSHTSNKSDSCSAGHGLNTLED